MPSSSPGARRERERVRETEREAQKQREIDRDETETVTDRGTVGGKSSTPRGYDIPANSGGQFTLAARTHHHGAGQQRGLWRRA